MGRVETDACIMYAFMVFTKVGKHGYILKWGAGMDRRINKKLNVIISDIFD